MDSLDSLYSDKKVINFLEKYREIEGDWRSNVIKSKSNLKVRFNQIEKIKTYAPKKPKILDVGCGTGYSLVLIRSEFPDAELHGIDLQSSKVWNICNEHGFNINFKKYGGVHFPYKDGTFDVITMFGVLEHVAEDRKDYVVEANFLKEINRVLKKDGVLLIFNLPNKYSYKEVLTQLTLTGFAHKKRYNRKMALELVKNAGFKVISIRNSDILPFGGGPARVVMPLLNLFSFVTDLEKHIEFPFAQSITVICKKRN